MYKDWLDFQYPDATVPKADNPATAMRIIEIHDRRASLGKFIDRVTLSFAGFHEGSLRASFLKHAKRHGTDEELQEHILIRQASNINDTINESPHGPLGRIAQWKKDSTQQVWFAMSRIDQTMASKASLDKRLPGLFSTFFDGWKMLMSTGGRRRVVKRSSIGDREFINRVYRLKDFSIMNTDGLDANQREFLLSGAGPSKADKLGRLDLMVRIQNEYILSLVEEGVVYSLPKLPQATKTDSSHTESNSEAPLEPPNLFQIIDLTAARKSVVYSQVEAMTKTMQIPVITSSLEFHMLDHSVPIGSIAHNVFAVERPKFVDLMQLIPFKRKTRLRKWSASLTGSRVRGCMTISSPVNVIEAAQWQVQSLFILGTNCVIPKSIYYIHLFLHVRHFT